VLNVGSAVEKSMERQIYLHFRLKRKSVETIVEAVEVVVTHVDNS
jgi:hypothetical protein